MFDEKVFPRSYLKQVCSKEGRQTLGIAQGRTTRMGLQTSAHGSKDPKRLEGSKIMKPQRPLSATNLEHQGVFSGPPPEPMLLASGMVASIHKSDRIIGLGFPPPPDLAQGRLYYIFWNGMWEWFDKNGTLTSNIFFSPPPPTGKKAKI